MRRVRLDQNARSAGITIKKWSGAGAPLGVVSVPVSSALTSVKVTTRPCALLASIENVLSVTSRPSRTTDFTIHHGPIGGPPDIEALTTYGPGMTPVIVSAPFASVLDSVDGSSGPIGRRLTVICDGSFGGVNVDDSKIT